MTKARPCRPALHPMTTRGSPARTGRARITASRPVTTRSVASGVDWNTSAMIVGQSRTAHTSSGRTTLAASAKAR